MALNLAPFIIKGTDKLRTGFRAKYNLLLNKVVKDWRVEVDISKVDYGFLYLITHDNTEVPLDLSGAYYTKEAIDELFGIRYATEEEAGVIRIATEEEALDGNDDLTVITPYKLWLVLSYLLGRTIVAAEELTAGQFIYLFIPEEDELIDPPVEPVDPEIPVDPEPFPGIPEEPEGDPGDPEDPEEPTEPLFPVLYAKLAVATSMETAAMGWVEYDALPGEETFIKLSGTINTYQAEMTPGTWVYLSSEDPGLITDMPSTTPGDIVQIIGYAISYVEVMVELSRPELNWDPVFIDFPELYFVVKKTSTQEVDLMDYFAPYNLLHKEEIDISGDPILVPYVNFSYKFLDLPVWVSDHTVVFDKMSLTGTAPIVGRFVAYLQVSNIYGRTFNQPLILNVIPAPKITSILIDTEVPETVGKIPGAWFKPDLWDTKTTIDGVHDKYILKITGGGASGTAVSKEIEKEVVKTELATYNTFLEENGIAGLVGLYKLVITTFVNSIVNSLTTIWFTLYDEAYIGKWKAELWDVVANSKIGDISIQDVTKFKQPANAWDVKSIVTGLNHDKVTIKFYLDSTLIKTTVYTNSPAVLAKNYYIYSGPQTGQVPGDYVVEESFELLGAEIYQRRSAFTILKKNPVAESGLTLVEMIPGQANYNILQELSLTGLTIDLPVNGFNVLCTGFGVEFDYVLMEYYNKAANTFNLFDVTKFTKRPDFIDYAGEPQTEVEILIFDILSSKEIGSIHKAPSSHRFKFTARLGGVSGEIVGVQQADVNFRIPLAPGDYSGLRFLNMGGGEPYDLLDPNMPKTGETYAIPAYPRVWTVSAIEYKGLVFDQIRILMKVDGVPVHGSFGPSTVITVNVAPTVKLPADDMAYIFGFFTGEQRFLYSIPGNTPINIDLPGLREVSSEFYRLGVLIGTSTSQFNLILEEDVEETPENEGEDCCIAKSFSFVNLTEWVANHNLDAFPDPVIFISGVEWEADITYLNRNSLKATFKKPKTGTLEIK